MQVVAAHTSDSIELVVFANGMAGSTWDAGFGAYDQAIDYATCDNDNGSDCPSISWALASDADRGQVLEISRVDNNNDAGFFIKTNNPYDATGFAGGTLEFDIQIVSGDPRLSVKVDCVYPCTSGDFELGVIESNNWQTVKVDINELVAQDLDLSSVDTGLVIWPTAHSATVFRLDRVRWVANPDGATATAGAVSQPSETWINPNFEGPTSATSYAGYSLYWSDEFTGDSLDSIIGTTNWAPATTAGAITNCNTIGRKIRLLAKVCWSSKPMSNNLEAANTPLHGSQLKTRCHLPMVAWIFAPHYQGPGHLASTVVTWGKLQHCRLAPKWRDRHYGNDWRQRSGGYSSWHSALARQFRH